VLVVHVPEEQQDQQGKLISAFYAPPRRPIVATRASHKAVIRKAGSDLKTCRAPIETSTARECNGVGGRMSIYWMCHFATE
jgi:hypothetical protein